MTLVSTLWTALAPHPRGTRVLATLPGRPPLLRATLRPDPAHLRALPTLLEALALWEGRPVHAALVAESPFATCAPTLFEGLAFERGAPLYQLHLVTPTHPMRPRADRFDDLARVLWREVAR